MGGCCLDCVLGAEVAVLELVYSSYYAMLDVNHMY